MIRPYVDADEAAVVALWQLAFPNEPARNVPADVIRRKLTVQRELFLVFEADGSVVGTVLAGFDGVRGWIHKLAVHPAHRRHGVASRLMTAAERGLAALGCPKVNLQVRATNVGVVDFYLRAGYAVEELTSMGKRLEPAAGVGALALPSVARGAREAVDVEAYVQGITNGTCSVCAMLAGDEAFRHHVVYRDDANVAFLHRYQVLLGHVLVAPVRHVEHVTGDFGRDEYTALQATIHRVAEAVRAVVPTERTYVASFGSQQGNAHVHWHVAPLPPGVPFELQPLEALRLERGVVPLSDDAMASLARRIAEAMAG